MAPAEEADGAEAGAATAIAFPPAPAKGPPGQAEVQEWVSEVDEVSAQIRGIIDGTITDFEAFDKEMALKDRVKQIREEEARARRERFFLYGTEGKGEGKRYKWWCKRCFVEYVIDLPGNKCTRCKQSDKMMSQEVRREELMGKLDDFKETKAKHQWRKDTWLRWKKSQALLGRSRNINYRAWQFWEPDTDTEDEGEPIVPRDNPEFMAMEADIKQRNQKTAEKAKTAERCRQRGNQCMKDGDFVGAIEHYDEGLQYKRDNKALWTNKALAELKVFRWHDAIATCNKVIEYSEIFEEGFKRSADACFKAFVRRAVALRALHKWDEALADLDDALALFPKDKESLDLRERTVEAAREAKQAQSLQQAPGGKRPAPPAEARAEADVMTGRAAAGAANAVRVEIEESDGGEEEAAAPAAQASALTAMSKKEFEALFSRLRCQESQRVLFCARRGGGAVGKSRDDTRKVDLKVEEASEPSRLDEALRDVERCCILWKKRQGKVVPLRDDVKHLPAAFEAEDEAADRFLQTAAPRVLAVFHVLASESDHHCALTAPAIRHVWPLLSCEKWRHATLELLLEWSQRSISARALAEFAGRYPDPHLRLLMEVVTHECKSNMLPSGFEERAQRASERVGKDGKGMEAALEEMMQGLAAKSPTELAVTTVGNLCLAGQGVAAFKEHVAPFCDAFVDALTKHLKPLDWRLCGRAAGSLCNLLRLGEPFAGAVEERCAESLVATLRAESRPEGSEASLARALRTGHGGLPGGGALPGADAPSADRLLSALVNLLTVRPSSARRLLELGLLEVCVPLMDPLAEATTAAAGSEGGAAVTGRAALLVGRLLGRAPGALPAALEGELFRRLHRSIEGGREVATAGSAEELEELELAVRTVATVLTKTPGALDRLTGKAPRAEELPDGVEHGLSRGEPPAVPFEVLAKRLVEIAAAAQPAAHVAPDEEGGAASRLRGNLALLLGALCEAQQEDNAPPSLRDLDLAPLVEPLVVTLRRERGSVQHNVGVCVTRLAQNPRYRQKVRDLNGIETLHQIQLPRVEAQKAEAARKHRLETSAEARKTEVLNVRSLRGLD